MLESTEIILYFVKHNKINMYRYDHDEDDNQEGFQKNPTLSEEIIVQSNHSLHVEPIHFTLTPMRSNIKHRYTSTQKPTFRLQALEDKYKDLKTSESVIGRYRPKMFKQPLQLQKQITSNSNNFTLPRRAKKVQPVDPLSNLDTLLDSVVIKTTRTQIAENIPMLVDNKEREQIIIEQIVQQPKTKVIYRQSLPDNTHTFFRHLLNNNKESNFVNSKYNLALRHKMQKTKNLPEKIIITSEVNDIEFRGDFESGNLSCVTKIAQDEYNIHLRIDTNTRGHRSWFYFKAINNQNSPKKIKINICNVTRRFRLIDKGQKIYTQTLNPLTPWKAINSDVSVQPYWKKKYKICFELELQPKQQTMVSLIPPYTYSMLLKQIEQFEKSPNVKVDILTHSVTGLAIPLLTITKGAARQRKTRANLKKKVLIISGRIHPSETCSSYIISGLIRELIAEGQQNQEFFSNNVIKIIPMLNPDGVVFGNFRTNYLGDDLNRSFFKSDQTIYPQVIALKQLGKTLKNDYGQNFIGFFDMHGHSGRPNSFVYGPEHEQGSEQYLQTRIFPKILDKVSKYFKYSFSTFKLEQYKYNTARGFFIRKLKIPAYTIQTSYALFMDKEKSDSNLQLMSVNQWLDYGKQFVQSILSYLKYVQIYKQNTSIFKKMKDKRMNPQKKEEDGRSASCIDFYLLKKEIENESEKKDKNDSAYNESSQESDGQSEGEDLPVSQKLMLVKQYKQTTLPSFLLPKVAKTSIPLPSVIPSILSYKRNDIMSTIPKLNNKYRQKKLNRPLNMSYEYTQYLLKNIADVGSLKPEIINFGFRKPQGTTVKKHSN